jgi:hypothetical protein
VGHSQPRFGHLSGFDELDRMLKKPLQRGLIEAPAGNVRLFVGVAGVLAEVAVFLGAPGVLVFRADAVKSLQPLARRVVFCLRPEVVSFGEGVSIQDLHKEGIKGVAAELKAAVKYH